jgi:hypothetical protein
MKRRAYIAKYPLNEKGNDLVETILFKDTFWSPMLSQKWDELVAARKPGEPMLQAWYCDENQVNLMAGTDQPFKLF